jgi:hypothetical protein
MKQTIVKWSFWRLHYINPCEIIHFYIELEMAAKCKLVTFKIFVIKRNLWFFLWIVLKIVTKM